MNSNNFLKFGKFTLGGTMISTLKNFSGNNMIIKENIIQYPDEIIAESDKNICKLQSEYEEKWKNGNITVTLKPGKEVLSVNVQSPEENLKYVTLIWNIIPDNNSIYLGDHWERSYGDLHWEKLNESRIMPWYFMEYNGKNTNGFGVRTGCNSMCFWKVTNNSLKLILDIRSGGNGVYLRDRILHAADIIVMKGLEGDSSYKSTRKFCKLMCPSPRLPEKPVYGINDWYFAYGNNSTEVILEHASLVADLATNPSNRPFCVVDAGWAEIAPGVSREIWADNFHTPNMFFNDMAKLAEKIKDFGMRPGIWVRSLCASYKDNENILLPAIPGRDNPKEKILDPTIPENIERIKEYFRLYNEWKYELIKHDFSTFDLFGKWGFQMLESGDMTSGNWGFYKNNLTNAEIVLNLYKLIREAAGNTYLIGCNTISHLSAGIFEIQRIGDDTSGNEWERTKKMGVNTLGFRIPQHNTFYSADGDCVGLTNKVAWEKNKQWMQLVAESGTPLFVSAQKDAVGNEQREFIKKCFNTASQEIPAGEPMDWLENAFPSKWLLNGKYEEFDW